MREDKKYIGVKLVDAIHMTRHTYNITEGVNPVGDDEEGFQVCYENGYISWCPEKTFLDANREVESGCMPFGHALEAVKKGYCISRKLWGGKFAFMSIYAQALYKQAADKSEYRIESPFLSLATNTGYIEAGWAPTQSDILSDDWLIVGSVDAEMDDGFLMYSRTDISHKDKKIPDVEANVVKSK